MVQDQKFVNELMEIFRKSCVQIEILKKDTDSALDIFLLLAKASV